MWRRDLGGYAITFGCIAAALLLIGYSLFVDGGSTLGFVAGLVAGHFAIASILAAVWSTGRKHLLLFLCTLFFLTAHGAGWATGLIPMSQAVGYTVGMIVAFLLGLSLSALARFDLDYRHRMGLGKARTASPGRNTPGRATH